MAFFIEQPDQEPVESELDPEVILAFYLNIDKLLACSYT